MDCPLCLEEMDISDLNFKPCACGYQVRLLASCGRPARLEEPRVLTEPIPLPVRPPSCGAQICRFCYHHIKENLNGRCPACRAPYDDTTVEFKAIKPDECVCPPLLLRGACNS